MKEIEIDKYNQDLEDIVKLYRRLKSLSVDFDHAVMVIVGSVVFLVADAAISAISWGLFETGIFDVYQFIIALFISLIAALILAIAVIYFFIR
ncbi:MAG: hypothetical protein JXA98_01060 [Methanosarcinaceae archaeon]|nr:hypothetical protein [Methanosarcinaceae archaeon]